MNSLSFIQFETFETCKKEYFVRESTRTRTYVGRVAIIKKRGLIINFKNKYRLLVLEG